MGLIRFLVTCHKILQFFSASKVLDKHKSISISFGIDPNDDELDLPHQYIGFQKMHKNSYEHRFIAGSEKCSTKPLSILLAKLLTYIKKDLQKYCENSLLKEWGESDVGPQVLHYLKSPNFNHITNIKSLSIFGPFIQGAKSRKYQGVFEVKSRVKTWQVRGIWSQQLEH